MKYILFVCSFLLVTAATAQLNIQAASGATNKYFSAELQAGYRLHNHTVSAGYTALPDNSQPVLFNIRTGYVVAERLHLYAGYVRVMHSSDDKSLNSNSWQVGTQYHFSYYNKGSFYAGAAYNGNRMLTVQLGMSWNLIRQ